MEGYRGPPLRPFTQGDEALAEVMVQRGRLQKSRKKDGKKESA